MLDDHPDTQNEFASHTIYHGKNQGPRDIPRVGLAFKPTPSLTYNELTALIRYLQFVADEMTNY